MNRRILIYAAALLCMLPLIAQDAQQSKPQDAPQSDQQKSKSQSKDKQQSKPADDANKPKPLFGGNVSAKSSSQKKDSTSLGFNGLDPQGKVEKALMNSAPSSADEAAVEKLAETKVDPAELKKFLDEGQLKSSKKGGAQ